MSRLPVISATDFANWVLPVPAGPSTRTGLPRRSARYTTPAMPSSARYSTPDRASRTAGTDSKRAMEAADRTLDRPVKRRRIRTSADGVAVPVEHVLRGGQLPQAHRAACVQLLGADPDLGPEAEPLPVHEPGRGVDEH